MAHKVHPKIFRIRGLQDWESRWFDRKNFPKYLEEDFRVREFINKRLPRVGIEKIEIERSPGKINIIISTARPGLIIGRGGGGVEGLKKEILVNILNDGGKKELKMEIREVKDPWLSAAISAEWIAQQLERRIPHRRALSQALEKIMSRKDVKGARVEVAGRLNGAEIARTAYLKKGRLPRQSIRADIDYAQARAYCTYGVLGIKVWIYKGDKFEEKKQEQ